MRFIIVLAMIGILYVSSVFSLGVASDFLANNNFILAEGTSSAYGIRIQNPSEAEINVKLITDGVYLKVLDSKEEYLIAPQSSYSIVFNVSAPGAKPGEVISVGFTVHPVSSGGSGVPLLVKINRGFNIKVVKNPEKFYLDDYIPKIMVALGILTIIIIFYFFWQSKGSIAQETRKKRKINKKKRK